eukprot:6479226-Amphidinium_carterae.1
MRAGAACAVCAASSRASVPHVCPNACAWRMYSPSNGKRPYRFHRLLQTAPVPITFLVKITSLPQVFTSAI